MAGFQSRLAALQFEWAWQNAWKSKHVSESDRILLTRESKKVLKSGEMERVPKGNQIYDKIQYLHSILQVPSFSRWPLTLHFLVKDVHDLWCKWDERSASHIKESIQILLDFKDIDDFADVDDLPPSGQAPVSVNARLIDRLDITYKPLKAHLEKSELLFSERRTLECAICHAALQEWAQTTLICPYSSCQTASHMSCLAKAFLGVDASSDVFIPIAGKCPGCEGETSWIDLVKELSVRCRGAKERAALMKKPRKCKAFVDGQERESIPLVSDPEDELEPEDEPLDDAWQPLDFDDEDDAASVYTAVSDVSDDGGRRPPPKTQLEIVIEDSDDDDLHI